jgi:hypothetical protein
MNKNLIDWTHKDIIIKDVRKLSKLYVLKIHDTTINNQIESPLFVKDNIFEERLKSYFLKDMHNITREEILSVKWNMYITRGYFIKIDENGDIKKINQDLEKWYISYLDIEGPLGTFTAIYRDKELNRIIRKETLFINNVTKNII